jgi:hypothetical protein
LRARERRGYKRTVHRAADRVGTSSPAGQEQAVAAPQQPAFAPPASAGQVLALQGRIGNAAVARLLQRTPLTGNPTDLPGTAPLGGTVHGTLPTMRDTVQGMDEADEARAPTPLASTMRARIKATRAAPLVRQAAAFPGWADLADFTADSGTAAPDTQRVLAVEQPEAEIAMTDGLYIEGQPRAADVQQGMIGDCWNLAVVSAIAARDPGKIMSIMAPDARGGATATFIRRHREVELGFPPRMRNVYDPVQVAASADIAFHTDATGRRVANSHRGHHIHGAQLIRAARPVDKHWWCEMQGSFLVVHSRATYELARWSPLLEKAFARFAQEHGQYGGTGENGEQSGGSGYADINGGFSENLYQVFYGEAGDRTVHPENAGADATAWDPGVNNLVNNVPVLNRLIPLQGRTDQVAPGEAGTVPIVTASTSVQQHFERLAQAIDFLSGFEEYETLIGAPTRGRIATLRQKLRDRAESWVPVNSVLGDAMGLDASTATAIARAARAVLHDADGDDLKAARSHERMGSGARATVDLVLNAMNAGTDNSVGQRNVYGAHAYTVLGVSFLGHGGEAVTLPSPLPADRIAVMATLAPLSQERSTVRLRNPHHGNEPDERGDGAPARPENGPGNDGVFTMGLNQFMVNFSSVESFVGPSSTPAPAP